MSIKGVDGGLVRVGATSGMPKGRRTSRLGAPRDGGFEWLSHRCGRRAQLFTDEMKRGEGLGLFVQVGLLDMIAEMMMNMREGLLAIATGAVAGGFANFFILRRTWLNAQALGDRSDGYVVELRKLHGKYDDVQREPVRAPGREPPAAIAALCSPPPRLRCASEWQRQSRARHSSCSCSHARFLPQRMEMPSLLDLRLRRDLSNAWNSWVVGFHAEASRWL